MALFFRVFASLFLCFFSFSFSFSVFAAGAGSGDTTTKWYKGSRAGVMICDTDLSKACIARYGGSPNEISVSCDATHYNNIYRNAAGGETIVSGYHDIATNTKTCTAPLVFALNKTSCTGSCIAPPPDRCADKKDQIKSFAVQCGTFNCPAGSKTVLDGSIVCDKAPGYFTPSTPPSSATFDGCALQAQAVPEFNMGDAVGLNAEVGGQTQAGFCGVEYKYTGASGTGADTPTSTNGTGFNVSYLPAGANGECPANYKAGTLNGRNICAPDSGSNTDPNTNPNTNPNGDPNGNPTDPNTDPNAGGDACSNNAPKVNGVCPAAGGGGGVGTASTSATCVHAPACNGDPLVCASIVQQWISTCEQTRALTTITDAEKTASQAAISAANLSYSSAKSASSSSASGILSGFTNSVDSGSKGGTCIPDVTIGVMGKTMVIPFSVACSFFRFLRMLVIFVSYLSAMRIVYKGAV